MKKIISVLILASFLLTGCNDDKKFEGYWLHHYISDYKASNNNDYYLDIKSNDGQWTVTTTITYPSGKIEKSKPKFAEIKDNYLRWNYGVARINDKGNLVKGNDVGAKSRLGEYERVNDIPK